MKTFTLTFGLLCACAVFVFAGPEPLASKEIAPAPPPPACCFDGWYFGVHGGGIIGNFDQHATVDEESLGENSNGFVEAHADENGDDDGAAQGGLQLGYNWCRSRLVFGIEADLSATSINQNDTTSAEVFLPNNSTTPYQTRVETKATVPWYSTVRPRLGYTFGDRFMGFLTGGLAFGEADLQAKSHLFSFRNARGLPIIDRADAFHEDRGIKFGWTGGGGFEFCLTQHVSLTFTYLYVDLEDGDDETIFSFVSPAVTRSFDARTATSVDNSFHVFQGGINFRF